MTKRKKLGIVIIFLVLLAAAVGIGGFLAQSQDSAPEFETVTAQRGTVTETVEATGAIAYPETREAAFLGNGYLDTLQVEVGETVAKDQLLATLRNSSGIELPEAEKKLLQLTAPMAGIVTAIHVAPGEVVGAGMPIVVIEGPAEQFEAVLSVSENDITSISVGNRVSTTVEAVSDSITFEGRVLSIAPTATQTEGLTVYAVKVSLDYATEDGKGHGGLSQLMPGMTADGSIATAESQNAVFVPRRAVITSGDVEIVRIPTDDTEDGYEEREVTTGLRDQNGNVEIIRGLTIGEEVITRIND